MQQIFRRRISSCFAGGVKFGKESWRLKGEVSALEIASVFCLCFRLPRAYIGKEDANSISSSVMDTKRKFGSSTHSTTRNPFRNFAFRNGRSETDESATFKRY